MSKKMSITIKNDDIYRETDESEETEECVEYEHVVVCSIENDYCREVHFCTNEECPKDILIVDTLTNRLDGTVRDVVMFNVNVTANVAENADQILPYLTMYRNFFALDTDFIDNHINDLALTIGFIDEVELEVSKTYRILFKLNPVFDAQQI